MRYYVKEDAFGGYLLYKQRRFLPDKVVKRFSNDNHAEIAAICLNEEYVDVNPHAFLKECDDSFCVMLEMTSFNIEIRKFVFTDADEYEYARNLAEEMIEKLNEKNLLIVQ